MHLYLIRHGQSFVNLEDWTGGNQDTGLTPLGTLQAEALAAWLPGEVDHADAIYCSTMQRARETAAPLAAAYDITIHFDDRLREVGNNRFDHTPWPSDDLPSYSSYWGSERPFASVTPDREGGESLMHFRTRVGAFVEELVECHRGENVLVVCHGGVIDLIFDHIFNVGPWRRCEIWVWNTGVSHFEYVEHPGRETWRLHYHSRTQHLQGVTSKS
jgi:probable phosphoglycerate mutase